MTMPTSIPAILALVSAPLVDLGGEPVDRLDMDRELAALGSWLGEPGRAVDLTVEWAETERLQRALLRRPFDLLHFTGHGGKRALAFEDGRGGLQPLTADYLTELVCPGGRPAFRLAFLSACHSGALADALLAAGVPHVVAVDPEETVLDPAAAAFARAFYAALLAGASVAAAFAQGQTSVRNDATLYRWGVERGMPALGAQEAAKFRLLPAPEEGGDHSAPLFPPGLPPGAVSRHDPPASPHRLGPRPETFTGRQRELHRLVNYALDNRLTVLRGMGGMGKTELARQAGRWPAERGHFPAGIGWADLREVDDLTLLRARLAEAAGLSAEAARSDRDLAAALAGDHRLLILDDLDAAVRGDLPGLRCLLEAICQAGGPHLLLTTRERLGGRPPAQAMPLGRLADDEAARLFLELARRACPDRRVYPADLRAVLEFLDGWPLALVLAAPLLADYSLAELLRRLQAEKEKLLADPLLPPEKRGKLDSVEVSLSLSYGHLEKAHPEAAQVFPLLALFPGGADEAALTAVLGPGAPAAVAALRAASLVEEAGGTRVRLPGPARAYAERRLPPDAWARYGPAGVAHYRAVTEAADDLLGGAGYHLGRAILLTELPNLHAFADWGLGQEGEPAAQTARLVGALRNLYMLLAWPEEGVERLRRAAAAAHRAGDARAEANVLKAQGDVLAFQDRRDEALGRYEQALGLFRAVGSRLGEANVLKAQGDVLAFQKQMDEALGRYEQALGLFRAVGDRLGEANTLRSLGNLYLAQGQPEQAMRSLDQALALYHQVGDLVGQANVYWNAGLYLAQNGQLAEAEPLLAQAVDLAQQFAPGHSLTLQWEQTLAQVRAWLAG